MKWKRNQSKFGKTPIPETPYQRAGQKEDRRLGRANARGNRWCLAFCGAMGLAALSTSGLIYQSAQASIVPWVVEVDESGAVKASGPAHTNFKPSDAQIAHQLARFISNVRSVSIDPVVLRDNWLNAYNNENDPFADIGQRSVTVDVTSIVRSSEDSFEVRWRSPSRRRMQRLCTAIRSVSMSTDFTGQKTSMQREPHNETDITQSTPNPKHVNFGCRC